MNLVRNENRFDPTSEPGSRSVLVDIAARFNRGQERTCNLFAPSGKVVDSSGVAHTALVSSLMQSNETFTGEPMNSLPFTEVGDPIILALADVKRLSRAWTATPEGWHGV